MSPGFSSRAQTIRRFVLLRPIASHSPVRPRIAEDPAETSVERLRLQPLHDPGEQRAPAKREEDGTTEAGRQVQQCHADALAPGNAGTAEADQEAESLTGEARTEREEQSVRTGQYCIAHRCCTPAVEIEQPC